MIVEIVWVVFAYALGSVPSALLLVRLATGKDVRETGSGNVGATNALRSAGWKVGVAVTVIDVGKGALPVWAIAVYNPEAKWQAAALLAAVVGHCFPVWLGFRGGKGVATGLGAFLVVAPLPAMAALVVWAVVLAVGRWVSLASMLASASLPLLLVILEDPHPTLLAATSVAAILIVVRHASNIRLILAGDEPRIGKG